MDINLPLSPPVNNNTQISLHDRLDAVMFEKIRVANTQLDTRLSLQEKIINKYRRDVEKVHAHQAQRLRREVKKIRQKKPDYVFDDSDASTSKSRYTTETSRQRCLSEPSSLSYCRRYYAHHYNVKDTSREEKKGKEGKRGGETDFFNLKLRLYFINVMNKAYEKNHLDHDTPSEYKQSSSDTGLMESFDARNTISGDENDDVFANSHTSFKSIRERYDNSTPEDKIDEINKEHENGLPGPGNANIVEQTLTDCESTADRSTGKCTDSVVNVSLNRRRGSRKDRGRKGKRKSVIGSGSEAEMVYNEAERRKSKHAFEKIFAGFL